MLYDSEQKKHCRQRSPAVADRGERVNNNAYLRMRLLNVKEKPKGIHSLKAAIFSNPNYQKYMTVRYC